MPSKSFLGIDTSCYTTSIAIVSDSKVTVDKRIMLKVPPGSRGLRQSEAVFAHIKNVQQLFLDYDRQELLAIGYSKKPCENDKSYMPVFVVGESFALSWSKMLGLKVAPLTHQHGHIYSAFIEKELIDAEYCAFHVSGGTLDVLKVTIDGHIKSIEKIGGSLDITCGQLIDRVGVAAGLPFPAGKHIEELYVENGDKFAVNVNGLSTNLSGAETQALRSLKAGGDKKKILSGVIDTVAQTICKLIISVKDMDKFIFTGGVMTSAVIREKVMQTCNDIDAECFMTKKEYCSDNAAGIALGTQILYNEGELI